MERPVAISYAVFALLLILVAALGLGTPFIAALFCYLALKKFAFTGRRWIALTLFLILFAAVFAGFVIFITKGARAFPEIAEQSIPRVVKFTQDHGIEPPFTDMESLKALTLDSVRDAFGQLSKYVRIATKEFVFLIIGIVVAIGIFLNPDFESRPHGRAGPLDLYSYYTGRIKERFASFYSSFETVIGAQIIISAINTAFTAVFLFVSGLRYATLVMILTFICGLLPIVGNVISNTIIVCIAFIASPKLAGAALIFLVLVHKFEYFLNSRIIGGRIQNPMWLTLLALLIGEQLMGIPGMILAPVVLSFIKVEMKKIGMDDSDFERPTTETLPRRELTRV
ncbi:MAG: AI-2E family transporter [Verrucomicrobiota bacterium]|nr:AI-2E family transporter [Verrucomicrobiota bacterium]